MMPVSVFVRIGLSQPRPVIPPPPALASRPAGRHPPASA